MPPKPVKYGIKVRMAADVSNGFVINLTTMFTLGKKLIVFVKMTLDRMSLWVWQVHFTTKTIMYILIIFLRRQS